MCSQCKYSLPRTLSRTQFLFIVVILNTAVYYFMNILSLEFISISHKTTISHFITNHIQWGMLSHYLQVVTMDTHTHTHTHTYIYIYIYIYDFCIFQWRVIPWGSV